MNKIKVLIVLSNPVDMRSLDINEEAQRIKEILNNDQFEIVDTLTSFTIIRLIDSISKHLPNIIHISGHGNSIGELIAKDLEGNSHSINQEEFKSFFQKQDILKNLKLLVLNACYMDMIPFELSKNIEFIIGTERAIQDSSAKEFSEGFYTSLKRGYTIQASINNGLANIKDKIDRDIHRLYKKEKWSDASIFEICFPEGTLKPANGQINDREQLKEMLIDFFQGQNIEDFCHSYFRDFSKKRLPKNKPLDEQVLALVKHCESFREMDKLKDLIQKENPVLYAEYMG